MIDTNKLIESINIQECIERYTGRRMHHHKTICPFHDDHEASLSVQTKKGLWRCWACDQGGNIINFTQQYFDIGFIEACRKLSEDFGIAGVGIRASPTKHDIWDDVEREVKQQRREELQAVRESIEDEIVTLTAVHRVLFHLGYEEAAARYSHELDDLEQYKEYWR